MSKYVDGQLVDVSCLDGEEFQVALRVAVNDLKDREAAFAEFLSESGDGERSSSERAIQYSRLHVLFAQTIVSTLVAEGDRRIMTMNQPQPRIVVPTSAAIRLAQARLRHSEAAIVAPEAPVLKFGDPEGTDLDGHSPRNHTSIHRGREIGVEVRGPLIIGRHRIVTGVSPDLGGWREPRHRWSQVVHSGLRVGFIRAAAGQGASEAIGGCRGPLLHIQSGLSREWSAEWRLMNGRRNP